MMIRQEGVSFQEEYMKKVTADAVAMALFALGKKAEQIGEIK